jgi:hypothetical protein
MLVFSASFNYNADAQGFLKKLGKKAKEAAERATERAVERKVEQKTEEAVSGAIDEVTDTDNYKSDDSDDNAPEAKEAKPKAPVVSSKPVSGSSISVSAAAKGKRYPFEKGIIYQQTSAMGMEATPVVYFDKFGDWTATETNSEMKILGFSTKVHTREIVKGDEHWSIDFEKETAVHFSQKVVMNQLGVDVDAMTDDVMKSMKIEKIGEEEYLGYHCVKYKMTDTQNGINITALMHGNLTMWAEGEAMGIPTSTYITKIDLSTPPQDMFNVPSDIKVTER